MKKLQLILLTMLIAVLDAAAQSTDHYSHSGKLMAVILCVSVILIGIGLFLFSLERRISKMEKSIEDENAIR